MKVRKSTQQKLEAMGYDLHLISKVQDGVNFVIHSDFIQLDGGYSAILEVNDYPKTEQGQQWFKQLLNTPNTITQIKIGTEDPLKVKKALSAARNASAETANNKWQPTEIQVVAADEADQNGADLVALTIGREVYKRIYVRIMIYDTTLVGLKQRIEKFKDDLTDFRLQIRSGEMGNYWTQLTLPASRVEHRALKDRGFPMKAYAFSGTYWFNQTFLSDPRGTYLGITYQSGEVMFDPSYIDGEKRLTAYNLIAGGERTGKSSLVKKLVRGNFAKGDTLWIFDRSDTKEYGELVKQMFGKTVTLDGSRYVINFLHVFATVFDSDTGEADEITSFNQHVQKVKTYYSTIKPDTSNEELNVLGKVLIDFYIEQRMWTSEPKVHPEKIKVLYLEHYPILDDLLSFINSAIVSREYSEFEINILNRIQQQFESLKAQYGDMVNAETSFPDLSKEQVVLFDTSGLFKLDPAIYAAQYFNILSLMNAYVGRNGQEQIRRMYNNEFTPESVKSGLGPQPKYFWWIQDEADDIFNAQNSMGIQFGDRMMAQQAKNFFGIIAAFPRLKHFFGSNEHMKDAEGARAMGQFYSRFQNKIYSRLDKTDTDKLRQNVGSNEITDAQLQRINEMPKGDFLLGMAGRQSIFFHMALSDEEARSFKGGL